MIFHLGHDPLLTPGLLGSSSRGKSLGGRNAFFVKNIGSKKNVSVIFVVIISIALSVIIISIGTPLTCQATAYEHHGHPTWTSP